MKAIEFVKKYGWFGAKEYLAGETFLNDDLFVFTDVEELQNLINAYELVKKVGGIIDAKKVLKKAYDSCSSIISNRKQGFECGWLELKDAIELVESVNGFQPSINLNQNIPEPPPPPPIRLIKGDRLLK